MDFVVDQLFNRRRIRALTVVDNFSREYLNITVGYSLKGEDVVNVMCYIYRRLGRIPKRIKVDNGSEFISKALDNGSFRDECLNANWFMSLEDAQGKVATWRKDYNEF